MVYSNKLKLDDFFWQARNQNYVIIKKSDCFPNYYKGSDIDIICEDENEFAKKILETSNPEIEKRNFEIRTSFDERGRHIHLDFFLNDELDFRFDIYGAIPTFKNIKVKNEFIHETLNNRLKLSRQYNGQSYFIYIPSEIDELIMRYIEYIELFKQRPDKIKHYDFILSKISSDKTKLHFLDKLHFCVDLLHTEKKDKNIRLGWYLRKQIKKLLRPIYYLFQRSHSLIRRLTEKALCLLRIIIGETLYFYLLRIIKRKILRKARRK